jgi:hypothetical protein
VISGQQPMVSGSHLYLAWAGQASAESVVVLVAGAAGVAAASVIAASLGAADAVGSAAGAGTAAVVIVSALARLGKLRATTAINSAITTAAVCVATIRDGWPLEPDRLVTLLRSLIRNSEVPVPLRTVWIERWSVVSEL